MKKDKEWVINKIESYTPLHDKTVGDVIDGILEIVKQMDEPEILSQEWIDENSYGAYELDGTLCDNGERFVSEKDLQNLLVPKQEDTEGLTAEKASQALKRLGEAIMEGVNVEEGKRKLNNLGYIVTEKPVIPKFVAEFIEENQGLGFTLGEMAQQLYSERVDVVWWERPETEEWARVNFSKFAQAWLDGYTVEEEKRYIVPLPGLVTTDGKQQYLTHRKTFFASKRNEKMRQTWKKEHLKWIPEKYREYAMPVEEMEE